ncbi:MAG TPA: hypothetical protein VGF55_03620 [Gemmataceae bacterium]
MASPNGRPRRGPDPAKADPPPDASREAKRLAAAILEVLAGLRTPAQAAQATNVSLPRYYQLEAQALAGLVRACERHPKGRRRAPPNEVATLAKENERLKRDLGRQQALVRLAQRSVGLSPPAAPAKAKRKRKPTTRALVAAEQLRQAADRIDGDPAGTAGS